MPMRLCNLVTAKQRTVVSGLPESPTPERIAKFPRAFLHHQCTRIFRATSAEKSENTAEKQLSVEPDRRREQQHVAADPAVMSRQSLR